LNEELFEEEEDQILSYDRDPLNRLLNSEVALSKSSESFSSFETLSVRENLDGEKEVVAHRHHRRKRESPTRVGSDEFASLSEDGNEWRTVGDSEWEEELSEASFCELSVPQEPLKNGRCESRLPAARMGRGFPG
jgi:hypothetical protein